MIYDPTLLGESVPQMKEAVVVDEKSRLEPLELEGAHKVHMLYGGTRILKFSPGEGFSGIPAAPNGGCLGRVVRTGFYSSQGKLVRMIEFSSEKVLGNVQEAFLLVGFLLIFALSARWEVWCAWTWPSKGLISPIVTAV